jgi:hypothetical protein
MKNLPEKLQIYYTRFNKGKNMKSKNVLAAATISILLGGCAVGGHDEFTRPDPERGVCTDAHNAMKLAGEGKTAKDFAVTRPSENGDGHTHSSSNDNERNAPATDTHLRDVAPIAGLMQAPIDQPKPVLLPATVIEMWFNSYEDTSGILYMSQTAFAEVTPRRWSLRNTKVERFKTQGPFLLQN